MALGGITSYSHQLFLITRQSPVLPLFRVHTSFWFSFSSIPHHLLALLSGTCGLSVSGVVSGMLWPIHAVWQQAGSSHAWSAHLGLHCAQACCLSPDWWSSPDCSPTWALWPQAEAISSQACSCMGEGLSCPRLTPSWAMKTQKWIISSQVCSCPSCVALGLGVSDCHILVLLHSGTCNSMQGSIHLRLTPAQAGGILAFKFSSSNELFLTIILYLIISVITIAILTCMLIYTYIRITTYTNISCSLSFSRQPWLIYVHWYLTS